VGVAAWIREAEATRPAAQARLAELTRQWSAPTADDLRAVIKRLNGVPGLLARATPERRRRLYTALGVDLRYDHRTRTVGAVRTLPDGGVTSVSEGDLNSGIGRVGACLVVCICPGQTRFSRVLRTAL